MLSEYYILFYEGLMKASTVGEKLKCVCWLTLILLKWFMDWQQEIKETFSNTLPDVHLG